MFLGLDMFPHAKGAQPSIHKFWGLYLRANGMTCSDEIGYMVIHVGE